jgi:predicted PurR-regulated permease PerM
MLNIFLIILVIFAIFIIVQLYFYSNIYQKNNTLIKKIENFETKLTNINKNNEYRLDDSSMELLLKDYNNLKDIKNIT